MPGFAYPRLYSIWMDTTPIGQINLSYYVDQYVQTRGTVAELGIGAGRIALEAARRGKAVIGIEGSSEMVRICRARASEAGLDNLISVIHADFRDFTLPEPADLISLPFHTIVELVTFDDKRKALQSVFRNLRPGGRFLFDFFLFDPELAARIDNTVHMEAEYTDEETGRDILVWGCAIYDPDTQTMRTINWTDELDESGVLVNRTYVRSRSSWLFPDQAEELLKEAGFQTESISGDFEGGPLDNRSNVAVIQAARP